MINCRYLSIVIYLVCLSMVPAEASWAKNWQLSAKSMEISGRKKTMTSSQTSRQRDNDNPFDSLLAQATLNQPPRFDRHWYIAGMAATSLLFLYTLTALFKPEKSSPAAKAQELVASSPETSSDLATTENEALAVAELAVETSFPMIGMDVMEELAYEPMLEADVEPSAPLRVLKSGTTVTESLSETSWQDYQAVDADVLGKLTVVTSKTTEIDVVFELIQDLQLSNTLADVSTQKDLRRKAIWELGQTNDFRAVEPLIRIIPQVDSLDKSLVLDAITQIANRSLKTINETLLVSLSEENPELRNNAIRDLNTLYQSISAVTVKLSRMIENSDREVQQIALWALEQFNQIYLPAASVQPTMNPMNR